MTAEQEVPASGELALPGDQQPRLKGVLDVDAAERPDILGDRFVIDVVGTDPGER